MVAGHYRWDFIGLSTDTKPDSSNPKVANGSTYYESDTSKLYVWYNNEWYEKTATGGGGYELPIASSTTLGGVKVGEGLEISESGVLSASGGGGGVTQLTSADYDFPNNNPEYVAIWRLPQGIYQATQGTQFATANDQLDYTQQPATFIVNKSIEDGTGNMQASIYVFSGSFNGLQVAVSYPASEIDGGNGGRYSFTLE